MLSKFSFFKSIVLFTFTVASAAPFAVALGPRTNSDLKSWDDFYENCDDFLLPGFGALVENWKNWQEKTNSTIKEINRFASSTCPGYYRRKQGEEALPVFIAESTRTGNLAIAVSLIGQPIAQFLDRKYKEFEIDTKKNNISFSSNSCGRSFAERRRHVAEELEYLKNLVLAVEAKCNTKFEAELKPSTFSPSAILLNLSLRKPGSLGKKMNESSITKRPNLE